MSPSLIVADCPACRGVGTVILGTCEVCFAEFFDRDESVSHGGEAKAPLLATRQPFLGRRGMPRRG